MKDELVILNVLENGVDNVKVFEKRKGVIFSISKGVMKVDVYQVVESKIVTIQNIKENQEKVIMKVEVTYLGSYDLYRESIKE